MEQIKAMLDAVVSADTLSSRQESAKNLLAAIETKFKVKLQEAKEHIDKASAAPVPDADAPVFKGGPAVPAESPAAAPAKEPPAEPAPAPEAPAETPAPAPKVTETVPAAKK